jgi:hypothetical protein
VPKDPPGGQRSGPYSANRAISHIVFFGIVQTADEGVDLPYREACVGYLKFEVEHL